MHPVWKVEKFSSFQEDEKRQRKQKKDAEKNRQSFHAWIITLIHYRLISFIYYFVLQYKQGEKWWEWLKFYIFLSTQWLPLLLNQGIFNPLIFCILIHLACLLVEKDAHTKVYRLASSSYTLSSDKYSSRLTISMPVMIMQWGLTVVYEVAQHGYMLTA